MTVCFFEGIEGDTGGIECIVALELAERRRQLAGRPPDFQDADSPRRAGPPCCTPATPATFGAVWKVEPPAGGTREAADYEVAAMPGP